MTPRIARPVEGASRPGGPVGPAAPEPRGVAPRGERFFFSRFLQLVVERLWLVLAVMIVFGVGQGIMSFRLPDMFENRATILVENAPRQLVSFEGRNSEYALNQTTLNTLVESIRNTAVLTRVARANALTNDPRFVGPGGLLSLESATQRLAYMISTRLRPTTRLIDITVKSTNAEIPSMLARSVALEFIADRDSRAATAARSGATTLEAEAVTLAEKVRRSEKRSQEFREKNEILSLRSRSEAVAQSLNRLNSELELARAELELATSDIRSFGEAGKEIEKLLRLKSIASDPTVLQMRQQVIAQELLVAGYTNRYKPAHPKRILAEKLLSDQRSTLLQLAQQAGQNLDGRVATLRAQIQRDEAELARTEMELKRLTRLTGEYSALEREVETDTALLQGVLKRIKELDLTTRVESVPISLVESPVGDGYRIGPPRTSSILRSVALGLAVSIGLIYLLQRIDSSLRTVDEVEDRLGLPVLGAIAVHKKPRGTKPAGQEFKHLVAIEDPTCITAEGFRSLRTLTSHLGRNEDIKIQLFTSAIPGEGKSFCSCNHAATLAKAGSRVVLIDLDLRRPTVGSNLGIKDDAPGVSSFLLGQKTFAEIQHRVAVEGLTVIPAGPAIPNPAEQLTRPYLSDLLAQAAAQFDYVVIDSAPINVVSDTLNFLRLAQVVLLVIQSGRTPETIVLRALLELRRAGNPARGIVLNRLPRRSGRGSYYYYFSDDDDYYGDAAARVKAK